MNDRFTPNCDVHHRDLQRPLYVDFDRSLRGTQASDFSKGAPGVYRQDFEDMDHCLSIRSSVHALRELDTRFGEHGQLGNGDKIANAPEA